MAHPIPLTDLHFSATIISFSDRILSGEKRDTPAKTCEAQLLEYGIGTVTTCVVPERAEPLRDAITQALATQHRLILILGGSGIGPSNIAPEIAREFIVVEIPGIAEQIRAHGLASTPLAGLSRGLVGISARDQTGCVIVSSPGSQSGATDTLTVLLPLLSAVYRQLGEPV